MEVSSLILTLILCSLSSLCFVLLLNRRSSPPRNRSGSVVLRGYPVVGNLPRFLKNMFRMLEWSTELIALSPSGTVVLPPFVFTSDPAVVEHVAKSRFRNYVKGEEITGCMDDFLGRGILNVNGDEWKSQRKSASYEFNAKSLRAFVLDKVRGGIESRLVPTMRDAARAGQVLDLQDVLERFAFDNICSLVLGDDPDCLRDRSGEGERFFRAFGEAAEIIIIGRGIKNFTSIWRLKKILNFGSERRLTESMAIVHEFVDKSLRNRRRRSLQQDGTFMSRLLADDVEGHSDEYLRDVLISFVLAGRDTTPSALAWFFWNLSARPDVVGKILDELRSIRSSRNAGLFGVDELREMNYLHAAISESLRLYPPVPLVPRKCVEDDVLPGGTAVKVGWMVMYNAYAMARMERVWGEDCREFRPERWLEEGTGAFRARNPFEYPVFHAGPRVCLGKEMAYVQMKAVAASILEGFEVEVVEERGKYHLGMTMSIEGGLPVKVRERGSLSNIC